MTSGFTGGSSPATVRCLATRLSMVRGFREAVFLNHMAGHSPPGVVLHGLGDDLVLTWLSTMAIQARTIWLGGSGKLDRSSQRLFGSMEHLEEASSDSLTLQIFRLLKMKSKCPRRTRSPSICYKFLRPSLLSATRPS